MTVDGGGVITISGNNAVQVMVVNSDATLTVKNLAVVNGRADWGGGIANWGTLNVTNTTFSGNSAKYSGGGIYNGFSATATLKNTLIANSLSGGDCVGPVRAGSIHNLIEDSANACGLTHGANGNIIGRDPRLGSLTGSPAYFPLLPGSPAIDAGHNDICAAPPVNNQSQNGVVRPQDGNGDGVAVCDIGAYEAPAGPPLTFRVYLPLVLRHR